MKIVANPLPFLDLPSSPAAAGSSSDYGRAFESTIRDVAKDSSAVKGRDEGRRPQDDGDRQPSAAPAAPRAPATDKVTEGRGTKSDDSESEKTAADAADESGDAADPVAYLGRLLAGSGAAAAAAAAKPVEGEAGDEARIIVVSLDPGPAEAAVEDGAVPGARGKVTLDVVHMETHFEPRSDAFVLVEGNEPNGMVLGAGDEGSAPMSFDQALARLSERKAGKAGATEEKAATIPAEAAAVKAAVADDVIAEERIKSRSRNAVAAERDSRAADRETAEVAAQGARSARKRDAAEASVDKIAARPERTTSDAADSRKSGATLAGRDTMSLPLASMTGQVAGRVIDALGTTLAGQRPSDVPSEAYLRMTAGGAALKTLTIQLQPETLGKLDVSMRLVEGQLTLEIAASEAETAKVLAQDREGLRKLLQHAGFSIDDTSITIVTRDASASPQVRTAAGETAQQGPGSGAQRDPRQRDAEHGSRNQGAPRDEGRSPSREGARPLRSSANYL